MEDLHDLAFAPGEMKGAGFGIVGANFFAVREYIRFTGCCQATGKTHERRVNSSGRCGNAVGGNVHDNR